MDTNPWVIQLGKKKKRKRSFSRICKWTGDIAAESDQMNCMYDWNLDRKFQENSMEKSNESNNYIQTAN